MVRQTVAKSIGTRRRAIAWRAALLLILSAFLSVGGAIKPAQAAGGYWIDGRIGCVNSADPVGVWVNANSGGSGWANTWVQVSDGWGYLHYNKWIPNGGSWYLTVGCGGPTNRWALTAYSDTRTGGGRILCNDIPDWLMAAKGRFPYLGWADFSQGVPRGRCA